MQVIVFLETGTGKTLIAALLVKHFVDKTPGPGSNIVCLVPTALLVTQQAAVFQRTVKAKVGQYTGDMGVDSFSKARWAQEFECGPH